MLRNGSRNLAPENVERIRTLRREPSASERVLWEFLRKRRLGGFLFRRQHPVGPYALDFYCAEAKVCVEVDGERHGERAREDEARDLYLERLGLATLRLPSLWLFEDDGGDARRFLAKVEAFCRERSGGRE